jgi:hypothetical protein
MTTQLEAIATMMGMEDVFHLKAAEIFEVINVEQVGITNDPNNLFHGRE